VKGSAAILHSAVFDVVCPGGRRCWQFIVTSQVLWPDRKLVRTRACRDVRDAKCRFLVVYGDYLCTASFLYIN